MVSILPICRNCTKQLFTSCWRFNKTCALKLICMVFWNYLWSRFLQDSFASTACVGWLRGNIVNLVCQHENNLSDSSYVCFCMRDVSYSHFVSMKMIHSWQWYTLPPQLFIYLLRMFFFLFLSKYSGMTLLSAELLLPSPFLTATLIVSAETVDYSIITLIALLMSVSSTSNLLIFLLYQPYGYPIQPASSYLI